MKEFNVRLANVAWSLLKFVFFVLGCFVLGSVAVTLLISFPSYLLDTYTDVNGVWWTVFSAIMILIVVMWEDISKKVKWLIEPLKNKKEEDVD